MRIRFWQRQSKQEILDSSFKKLEKEESQAKGIKTKKAYTPKFYMMILSGVVLATGVAFLVIYFNTLNIVFGLPGIMLVVASIFVFLHYWREGGDISIEHLSERTKDEQANSLNLYPDKIEFENVYDSQGFPWGCEDDGKKYFVNEWSEEKQKLFPFILPDLQFCAPDVFAQRVLELPAHRKIFERKPKLLQKLKTALLVLAIGIVWMLILTTTGS